MVGGLNEASPIRMVPVLVSHVKNIRFTNALTIRLHLRDEGIGLVADTGLATAIVCHCQVPTIRNR